MLLFHGAKYLSILACFSILLSRWGNWGSCQQELGLVQIADSLSLGLSLEPRI